ncbi:MAG: TolC family protein [bacterium]|nr:TolC family protein [bacterium]
MKRRYIQNFQVMLFILFFHFLFFTTANSSNHQMLTSDTPITVDQLIEKALQVNPTYRSVWEEQTLVKYTLYRALGQYLPSFDLSSSYRLTDDFTNHRRYGTSTHGIGISYTIWDGGSRYGTLRNAKLAIQTSPWILTRSQQQIAFEVRQAYHDALATFELTKAARSAVELRKELLKLAETKQALGSATELDVLSTKVQLGTAENALLATYQDSILARQKLNQVVGIALTSNYPLAPVSDTIMNLLSVDTLVEIAKKNSPAARISSSELERSRNNLRAAYATWFPTLTLDYSISYSEQGSGIQKWTLTPENGSSITAISLRYPLFTGFQRTEIREKSKVDQRKTKWEFTKNVLEIEKNVRESYARLEQALAQIRIAEGNLALAKSQRLLQQERYRVGAATLLEVQTAQNEELNAEIELIKKRLTARTAKALLELSVGESIVSK